MSGGKPCDSCKTSGSLVFCLSDSAALCLACDARIHAPPAPPQARVWMCEVCELSPASLTCKADDAVLCATCDSDIHSANPLARRHERVPLVPFLDSRPARSNGILHAHVNPSDGLDEDDKCKDEDDELETTAWLGAEGQDLKLFADVDPYLDLDYSASMDGGYGATSDSVVPVQDRPLLQPQHLMPPSSNSILELDFSRRPKPSDNGYTTLSHSVSSSSLDVGVVPDGNNSAMADISNPFGLNTKLGIEFSTTGIHQTTQVLSQDREARVLRYREKRKNRKFEKTIRYASRKAYAEVRPRIKGRFAKRTELTVEIEGIYAPPSVLMADAGYGVVPTF